MHLAKSLLVCALLVGGNADRALAAQPKTAPSPKMGERLKRSALAGFAHTTNFVRKLGRGTKILGAASSLTGLVSMPLADSGEKVMTISVPMILGGALTGLIGTVVEAAGEGLASTKLYQKGISEIMKKDVERKRAQWRKEADERTKRVEEYNRRTANFIMSLPH